MAGGGGDGGGSTVSGRSMSEDCSARHSAPALAKRSSGCSVEAISSTASRWAYFGSSVPSSGGVFTELKKVLMLVAENMRVPVRHSNTSAPSENTSPRAVASSASGVKVSGAA